MALCSLLVCGTVMAQAPDPVAQQVAQRALDVSDITFRQRTGQLSTAEYSAQLQRDESELSTLRARISALAPARQAEVQRQIQNLTQVGLAKLRTNWTLYLASHTNSKSAADAAAAAVPRIPVMPTPAPAPVIGWLGLLLVPAAGGGAWLFWRRRRRSTSRFVPPPTMSPQPRAAAQAPVAVAQPQARAAVAQVAVAAAPLATPISQVTPISQPKPISQLTPASPPTPEAGANRDRLLAQVQSKYQSSLTAAVDQLTETQRELSQLAALPESVRAELLRIGGLLLDSTRRQVRAQSASAPKAFAEAALLLPFWRLFKGSLARKVLFGIVAYMVVAAALRQLAVGAYGAVIVGYAVLVGLMFYFSRRAQSRGALAALDRTAASLKTPRLLYVYPRQLPAGQPGALSVQALRFSTTAGQVMDDFSLDGQSDESVLGAFFVWLDNAAVYRVDAGGGVTLTAVHAGNALMSSFAGSVTQAMAAHAADFEPMFDSLRQYAELKWRERSQRADIPRLEKLLANATRLTALWREVVVTDTVFEFLIRRIDLFNLRDGATPNGILLYGYPGNGKEYLARKIAESVFAQFIKLTADQLASPQTIKELWSKAAAPAVLFVDYADQVFARTGDQEGAGREATLSWLEEWSRHEAAPSGLWVILTAQSDQNLHPRVLAHLGSSKIEVSPPDAAGRTRLLAQACVENRLPAAVPPWLVETSGGSSVRELRDVVREARLQSLPEAPTEAHWRAALRSVRGSDSAFRDESKTWDRLVLPPDTKAALQRASRILREADRYRDKKVNVPNILLFGPPGTGKTDIARTFANEGGVKFIVATTADLKAPYVGQSAPLVRALFARARAAAPCVLFIDEVETVAAKRGATNADAFTQDIVTEMLAQMDGARVNDRPIIVLAATNLPDQIDPAILSRFTSRIEIALPDEAARRELLLRLIRERPLDPALDVEEIAGLLAKRLTRRSGRDLVMLVNRAMEQVVAASDSPDDVRLTRAVLLAEVTPQGREVSEADLAQIWGQIVLPPEVKADLLDKIRLFNRGDKAAPPGLLLYGPPGTGKTEIARRIADSASCHFMALKGPDLKAGYIGQSGERVQKIWAEARGRVRCVIFIDECEGVFARRGGSTADSASEELVQAFLAEWDGVGSEEQRVWVIGATNRRDLIDEAIVSRFGAAMQIDLPGPAERLEILRLVMAKLDRPADVPEFLGAATTGLSGRSLGMVAREVCTLASRQGGAIGEELWREVLRRHVKAGSESVDEGARWDSLILPPETLDKLRTLCEQLRYAELFQAQGIDMPKGALLYGPPGTGKTQIARTLANESGLPFIAATTAEMKAGFVGQSGQKVRELFQRARERAPCILFIDEIETVAAARGGSGADSFTGEIVTQLLQEIDGVRAATRPVFVLAATNLPDTIDAALLSRFEERIEIGRPDGSQRQRLFSLFLSRQRVDFDRDAVAAELAELTPDVGGRDIRSLIQRASQQAIRRAVAAGTPQAVTLTRADLVSAVKGVRV